MNIMKKLDSKFVWLLFISGVINWLFISLFLGFYLGSYLKDLWQIDIFWAIFWGVAIILVIGNIFSYIWSKLTYYFYRYEISENGFKKESGVIYKKYVTIPYDRIQNVDINRGILARILGLSDLNIQTAGNSAFYGSNVYSFIGIGAEGRLPGLSKDDAESIRDILIKKARESRINNQGL